MLLRKQISPILGLTDLAPLVSKSKDQLIHQRANRSSGACGSSFGSLSLLGSARISTSGRRFWRNAGRFLGLLAFGLFFSCF